ncbi:unnamed protein product, partial [marine sediment metagenome]
PEAAAAASQTATRTHPLAITALVLSCCGFICFPLTAIAGIICGHIARAKISKAPGARGSGMALAALLVGYGWALLGAMVLAVVMLRLLGGTPQ